jgi:hypothetical protein
MLVLTLVLSTLLAAPPAASDPPTAQVRYQRQSSSAPRAPEDALERRLERAKRAQAHEAEQLFHDSWQQFRKCRACVSHELLLEQIDNLLDIVETTSEDDVDYPDSLFRLADHYLEAKAHHALQAASLEVKLDELEFEMEAFDSETAPKAAD